MFRFASSTILAWGFSGERVCLMKRKYDIWYGVIAGRAENAATLQVCAAIKSND
jgi:hypothetical protein